MKKILLFGSVLAVLAGQVRADRFRVSLDGGHSTVNMGQVHEAEEKALEGMGATRTTTSSVPRGKPWPTRRCRPP